MSASLAPLTFEPILVPKPWGGRRLADLGKRLPGDGWFGESWEVADLPPESVSSASRGRTVVDDGPQRGLDLGRLIASFGDALLGSAAPTPAGDFPLLLKYLDAREHLSVQVHPDAAYVATHPRTHLKTESWYVMDAEPDAVLYLGFRDGVEQGDVERCAGTAALVDLLQPVPAVPGEFHHLPAGIVHALGAGVMVAEPQTPSDTTFRLYDWADEYGRAPRDLHFAEGLEAVRMPARPESLTALRGDGRRVLVETAHYSVVQHRSSAGTVELDDRPELRIVMVVGGEVIVSDAGEEPRQAARGRTVLIPAAAAPAVRLDVAAPATVLEIALVPLIT